MTLMQTKTPTAELPVAEPPPLTTARLRAMDPTDIADLAEQLGGSPVPGVRMTEREFVEWSLHRVDAEWVDGEVVLVSPENDWDNDLRVWLSMLLGMYVEAREAGVVRNDMFVRIPPPRRRRRVPDVFFVSNERLDRVRPTFIEGGPDLVIEIVSPDSQNRDRRDKYLDYEAAGVREYWIIDQRSQTVDLYALRGRRFVEVRPKDGRLHSKALAGFFLRPAWLTGEKRPKVAAVLKELAAYKEPRNGARSRPKPRRRGG